MEPWRSNELGPKKVPIFLTKINPLVPDRTLKYVFSEKSFRYFFSHNSSISYAILKIQKAATPQDPRASFW